MPKTTRSNSSAAAQGRDLRTLLHVPQHDLQAQLASRLERLGVSAPRPAVRPPSSAGGRRVERLGFPTLRPALGQLLSVIGTGLANPEAGVQLSDLVSEVSLPKQTV